MTALRILLARLLGLLGGDARRERELRAEIDAHIAEAAEEFERQGVPADRARRLAFVQFGGVTQTMEAHGICADSGRSAASDGISRTARGCS